MSFNVIDLSQEIFQGMSVFPMHQPTFIMTNMTHEENMKNTGSKSLGFSARNLLISEHCGTHCDAVWEYKPSGNSIENMPLQYFFGSAICIDLSHIPCSRYIEANDIKEAINKSGQSLSKGDIVLLYTGHYDRNFETNKWQTDYSGLSYDGAKYLAGCGVVNIGVDAPSIDHPHDINFSGHLICGEYDITNTENLCNLEQVVNKRFLYFGLPLKIRAGSGSPIRAIALVEN